MSLYFGPAEDALYEYEKDCAAAEAARPKCIICGEAIWEDQAIRLDGWAHKDCVFDYIKGRMKLFGVMDIIEEPVSEALKEAEETCDED